MIFALTAFIYYYVINLILIVYTILKKNYSTLIITIKFEKEEWGYYGELPQEESRDKIIAQCEKLFDKKCVQYLFGKDSIKKIACVSGGYYPNIKDLQELKQKNTDLLICGENS